MKKILMKKTEDRLQWRRRKTRGDNIMKKKGVAGGSGTRGGRGRYAFVSR